ncbi:Fpg/Nei family DNA glycosylase [Streptomyces griseus]|uniref:Fpg/Nei family DNA glycosylase n=1 Tax=Streptomyces griseus TaxID=1911 RepID=UPI0036509E80
MSELPDVEGFRRRLDDCGRGRRVTDVDVLDSAILRGVPARRLTSELTGQRLGAPWRHGKWLFAPTDGGPTLGWHFGMTGSLLCDTEHEEPHRHDRLPLTLDDGVRLHYRDQRKLKGAQWLREGEEERLLEGLGTDASDVTRAELADALAGRRGAVKSALMNQSVLAGLGNLLSDEVLWRARIDPRTPARDLDADAVRTLHGAMRRTLRTSMRAERVPPRHSWLTGRRDEPDATCPRCGRRLEAARMSGRRTVWCPHCQK